MDRASWILILPLVVFGTGVWLFLETENEVRVQYERAREKWRQGEYDEAILLYRTLQENHPKSRFADDALWEIGTVYYINAYDVSRAIRYFRRLVEEYPQSPLAVQAYLKLAEIHEMELGEISAAIEFWKQALNYDIDHQLRQQIRFKIADAWFKLNQFDAALALFRGLCEQRNDEGIAQQARVRAGTILQIQKRYAESVPLFQAVLGADECPECRVQAQLGLIESYEFMDDLPRALEIARAIETRHYPTEMKDALIRRLSERQRYYQPRPWQSR